MLYAPCAIKKVQQLVIPVFWRLFTPNDRKFSAIGSNEYVIRRAAQLTLQSDQARRLKPPCCRSCSSARHRCREWHGPVHRNADGTACRWNALRWWSCRPASGSACPTAACKTRAPHWTRPRWERERRSSPYLLHWESGPEGHSDNGRVLRCWWSRCAHRPSCPLPCSSGWLPHTDWWRYDRCGYSWSLPPWWEPDW